MFFNLSSCLLIIFERPFGVVREWNKKRPIFVQKWALNFYVEFLMLFNAYFQLEIFNLETDRIAKIRTFSKAQSKRFFTYIIAIFYNGEPVLRQKLEALTKATLRLADTMTASQLSILLDACQQLDLSEDESLPELMQIAVDRAKELELDTLNAAESPDYVSKKVNELDSHAITFLFETFAYSNRYDPSLHEKLGYRAAAIIETMTAENLASISLAC